jgi:hypothetical protein
MTTTTRHENLTDDEQVLFDLREAIAEAHLDESGASFVGTHAAEDAIRRMHNMGLVARRKRERSDPEPDLSAFGIDEAAR